jgi:N-acetylglucosamine-6-sulfatase
MDVRQVLRSAALGVASLLVAVGAFAQDPRPNLIVIATDDLRFDAISAYGHPFNVTPNLDQLAADGVRFDRSYGSTPLCSPWRASFLTGQYMSAHGWTGNDQHAARRPDMEAGTTMWQELLQDAGYRTGYVGKYHLDTWMGNGNPANLGGTPREGWDYWAGFTGNQGTHTNIQLNVNGAIVNTSGYTSDTLATYANNFLGTTTANEPFAMVVSYKAVHAPTNEPTDVSPANRNLYSTGQVQAHLDDDFPQNNYSEAILDENKPILSRAGGPAGGDPEPGVTGPNNAAILGQLRQLKDVDDSIGRILAELQSKGLMDNTVIAFTSDSGIGWREHGLGGKSLPYEFSARTPLIMYHPTLAAGGQTPTELVTQLDLTATLLDAAGVELPATMQGTSLLPYLDGSGAAGREVLYLEQYYDGHATHTNSWQAAIDDRFKYIRYNDYDGVDELYDMQADPYEIYNVINNPAYAADLKRLQREVQLGHGAAISPGEVRPVYAVPTTFNDFTLNENGGAINNTGSGSTNRVGALGNQGGGRNVFFMVELPVLVPGERVAEASFQFLLTNTTNNIPANVGADLWAVGIFANDNQSHALGEFHESENDSNPNHVKIADDLLTPSTVADQIIRTDAAAATTFADVLNDFYDSQVDYEGGSYLFLRLNPDADLGVNGIGWDLVPVENIAHGADPLMLLTAVPAPETTADFDADGDVDGADFLTWQRNVSTTSGATLADGNANAAEDGDVDGDDLAVWKAQFGASAAPSSHQVPEPSAIALAGLAALVALCALRQR